MVYVSREKRRSRIVAWKTCTFEGAGLGGGNGEEVVKLEGEPTDRGTHCKGRMEKASRSW